MNPYERRIIHSALQNDKYVFTRSEGEEPFRHVVISLKREEQQGKTAQTGPQQKSGRVKAYKKIRRGCLGQPLCAIIKDDN